MLKGRRADQPGSGRGIVGEGAELGKGWQGMARIMQGRGGQLQGMGRQRAEVGQEKEGEGMGGRREDCEEGPGERNGGSGRGVEARVEPVLTMQDLEAIMWLQHHLKTLPQTVVITSHDQALLDAVAEETIALRHQGLKYFPGPPSEMQDAEDKERVGKVKQQAALDKRKEHASLARLPGLHVLTPRSRRV